MTATFAITALVTLDVVSPFTLYYNSSLIMQGQVRKYSLYDVGLHLIRHARLASSHENGCLTLPTHVVTGARWLAGLEAFDELFVLWTARNQLLDAHVLRVSGVAVGAGAIPNSVSKLAPQAIARTQIAPATCAISNGLRMSTIPCVVIDLAGFNNAAGWKGIFMGLAARQISSSSCCYQPPHCSPPRRL